MGVLVQGGNDAAETKKKKNTKKQKKKKKNQTNKNASHGRYHICSEINRSLDNWLSIFV